MIFGEIARSAATGATEDDPHAWEVSFRISSAEMAPWAQLDGHADTVQVEFVEHRTASAIVEG